MRNRDFTVTEDYTRITEFKYLTGQKSDKTTIMKEYSRAYEDPNTQTPYYAILSDENRAHYERYRALTAKLPNFYAGTLGRVPLLQHGQDHHRLYHPPGAGVALTTSIRDFFHGDYLSGAIRMLDAVLVGGCIAMGVGVVVKVLSLLTGGALL